MNFVRLAVVIWLLVAAPTFAGPPPSHFEALYDVHALSRFSSTNEIVNYFQQHAIDSKVLPLLRHTNYFCMASYPYSGLDTIDFYCFRNRGAKWSLQTLHFVVHPPERKLKILEQDHSLVVRCENKDVLTFPVEDEPKFEQPHTRLNLKEVIRIANEALVKRGTTPDRYNAPEAFYEFTVKNKKWSVFYMGKEPIPGNHCMVEVDDKTGEAGFMPGM